MRPKDGQGVVWFHRCDRAEGYKTAAAVSVWSLRHEMAAWDAAVDAAARTTAGNVAVAGAVTG